MTIPRLPWPDDTLRLLRDGYLFGERGFRRAGRDEFRTRLMGRPVIVVRGLDAARFFYEGGRFDRSPGAVPRSAVHLLQDAGSVQTLEGAAHAERKRMFLEVLADPVDLVDAFRAAWLRRAELAASPIALIEFASQCLADAVEHWAGIEPGTFATGELTSMIDNAGQVGPLNWAARARRIATERTARGLIRRSRELPPGGSPLSRIAHHVENGEVLPEPVAAVELLNLLRPTVAVARFIVFAGWALHHRRDLAPGLGSASARYAFAQEVRRFFPFFPLVGGHARSDLAWGDEPIPAGTWVMLDLYGTDHHPGIWSDPGRFDPARFGAPGGATPVAQGMGEFASTHHCPGEPATDELIATTLELLATGPGYRVPEQDLRISLRGFPAAPRDGFMVRFGGRR